MQCHGLHYTNFTAFTYIKMPAFQVDTCASHTSNNKKTDMQHMLKYAFTHAFKAYQQKLNTYNLP